MQLADVQHRSAAIEARQSRVKSIALRNEILQKQTSRNYQSEYDRIRVNLEDSAIPHKTRTAITHRTAHLKQLGARAVEGIA